MASKKLIIETEVKTDQVDSAVQKLGQLKDLGRGLQIQYDIDGKPIDVVIDKTLNLQKQSKILLGELRKTKEGTAEFQLLSSKLGEVQDGLARTKVKSGDLFTSLQLLPGPIGDFASQINGAIALLKTFSGFSLKDLRFQLKETFDDFSDISDNLFDLNKGLDDVGGKNVKATVEATSGAVSGLAEATTAGAAATVASTVAVKANTVAQEENIVANVENIAAQELNVLSGRKLAATIETTALALGAVDASYKRNIVTMVLADGTTVELTKSEILQQAATLGVVEANGAAAVAAGNLAVANEAAAASTGFLTAALRALGTILTSTFVVVTAFIGGLALLGVKLYDYLTATNAAEEATKTFKTTLIKNATAAEEARNKIIEVGVAFQQAKKGAIDKKVALDKYNEILGGTIGKAETLAEAEKLYKDNTENYIKATGLRAEAQELFRIAAQKAAEAITAQEKGFFSFDRGLFQSRGKANAIDRLLGRQGELEERGAKLLEEAQRIRDRASNFIAQAGLLETGFKPKEEKKTGAGAKDDSAFQNLMKDLDAQIQLEIDKENTRRDVLQKLLDLKRKLITDHDKLTYFQVELLKAENSKKIESALNDDNKVLQEKLKKAEELRVAAIDDEEERELAARSNQLYYDKIALQEQFKTQEEFDEAVKNLQIQTDRDLLNIRDKFFQKRFKQEQEAYEREKELRLKNVEQELATDQQRIDDKTKFNEVFGDFFFGNKGLKGIYEKYFVDIRKAYQEEYDNDVVRYNQEEEKLKANLGAKIITRETYENQIVDLNNRRTASAEKNTAKQLELDKLEVDSKRASADMTIQIGQNLVGLLGALDKRSKDLQVAAAIVEAGVSIARIIVDTQRAIIAFSASVAPLGPAGVPIAAGYAVKAKVAAGLSIATIIASGIGKLKEIGSSDSGGSGQSTSSTTRGMEKGGMIGGRRHAQGGTLIEAEQGEAIMTRGAVSLFGPMLSMMNQAGGGTSFNSNLLTTRQDNPILSNPAQEQAPIVVKTYVVEKDMVSQMNKQARLKDLSTL